MLLWRSQQIIPSLLARDGDPQSFQVLLHLLGALFHRVLRKELSDIGFELRSYGIELSGYRFSMSSQCSFMNDQAFSLASRFKRMPRIK